MCLFWTPLVFANFMNKTQALFDSRAGTRLFLYELYHIYPVARKARLTMPVFPYPILEKMLKRN